MHHGAAVGWLGSGLDEHCAAVWARAESVPQLAERASRAPDDVGCLNHDDTLEHLVADHHRGRHQDIGVPARGSRNRWMSRGEEGVGQWPIAQQRLIGVGQDHSLGVGEALDFFAELLGLLDPPAHRPSREGDAARQAPQAGHARGVASA
jgi:hypothetical protein